ncbi:MAG: hypothetical protein ACYDER_14725 [Ktedonobacteraceae bacterium]
MVVFPDGRVANATSTGNLDNAANLQAAGNRLVTVWTQDVIFVMNQLDRLNATPGNLWSQRLDLARLGVFGIPLAARRLPWCARWMCVARPG